MKKATIDEILSPAGARSSEERARRVRDKFWRTLKRAARQIPFVEDVVAAYYCALDTQTPTRVRGILLAALAYFVLPVDVIPDFIAGFGFTDDVAVLSAAITAVRTHITPAHYAAARASLAGED
ncbi:MAG: YkvA family protein [Rhizobiaceae bacterium]